MQITDRNDEGVFGLTGSRLIQLDHESLGFGWHSGRGPVPSGAGDLGTVLRLLLGAHLAWGEITKTTACEHLVLGTMLSSQRRELPLALPDRFTDAGRADSESTKVPGVRQPIELFWHAPDTESDEPIVTLIE